MIESKGIIIFVAGEGGHFVQFKRLYIRLKDNFADREVIVLTDSIFDEKFCADNEIRVIKLGALRPKSGFSLWFALKHFLRVLSLFTKFHDRDISLLSTGPGIAIFPSILTRLYGGRIVHIETWSRFNSASMTGRAMHMIANRFYVQNKSLQCVYRKSIYSGRL